MTPKRVQRKRTKGWRMPENTVYVGRGSRWGNPYPVGSMYPMDEETWAVLNAESSVRLYREHLSATPWGRPALSTQIVADLAGKDLACWCPLGQPCHADVLLELANHPAGEMGGA
jgi:hypothetical protein